MFRAERFRVSRFNLNLNLSLNLNPGTGQLPPVPLPGGFSSAPAEACSASAEGEGWVIKVEGFRVSTSILNLSLNRNLNPGTGQLPAIPLLGGIMGCFPRIPLPGGVRGGWFRKVEKLNGLTTNEITK